MAQRWSETPSNKRPPISPLVPEWMKPKLGRTMKFSHEYLTEVLKRTFDVGNSALYELKDQLIDEILSTVKKGDDEPWVVFTLKDLKTLPHGHKLFHSMFGQGEVVIKKDDNGKLDHFVQFPGFRMDLAEEGWPWTEKIQVLS